MTISFHLAFDKWCTTLGAMAFPSETNNKINHVHEKDNKYGMVGQAIRHRFNTVCDSHSVKIAQKFCAQFEKRTYDIGSPFLNMLIQGTVSGRDEKTKTKRKMRYGIYSSIVATSSIQAIQVGPASILALIFRTTVPNWK